MSSGIFRVYNENGKVILDTSYGLCKYLGTFTISTSAGSITDNRINNGRVWYAIMSSSYSSLAIGQCMPSMPKITVNGSTISWNNPLDINNYNTGAEVMFVQSYNIVPVTYVYVYGTY